MIITANRNTPVSSGVSDTIDYKIDVSNLGHIASILRKAYSDPIRAVIREYGTNACEGHILNGRTDKPIQVSLPTSMKPVFTVRDFGPGLGRLKFQELFCSYGGSDKRTSNAFTGCLGIGCKSYGAYTDAVTVTDYNDGMKRIWNCHIDESEVGKASLLSETKAHDLSGVEITIPVRPSDITRFRNTAVQVYRVFDVKPNITNLTPEGQKEYDSPGFKDGIIKGKNWAFNGEGNSWLQMGLVLYPLKADFSGSDVIKQLINSGVYVRVELGDVQVAPSREDLQYSQKTIQGLIKNLSPVIDSMSATLLADIQSAPDYLQAHLVLSKFTKCGSYTSSDFREKIVKKMKGKLKWKGIDMAEDSRLQLCAVPLPKDQSESEVLAKHGITVSRISKRSWGKAKFHTERNVDELVVHKSTVVMVNDTGTGSGDSRVRHWLTDGGGPKDATVTIINYKNGGKEFLNKTLPWFATTTFEQVSSLPKPPPKAKVVNEKGEEVEYDKNVKHSKGNVFGLLSKYERKEKRSDYWGITASPSGSKKVYVILNQFKWLMPGKNLEHDEYYPLFRARDYLKEIGYCDQVYGVKQADVDKKIDGTWTSLLEAIEVGTRAFLKANPDKAQKIADRYAVLYFFGSRGSPHERMKRDGCFFDRSSFDRWCNPKTGRLQEINSDSPFRIFMEKILDMVGGKQEQLEKDLPAWLHEPRSTWASGRTDNDDKKGVYRQLRALLPTPSYDLKVEGPKIASRYPLLCQNDWQSDVMEYAIEGTVEYMHLVDAARKTK